MQILNNVYSSPKNGDKMLNLQNLNGKDEQPNVDAKPESLSSTSVQENQNISPELKQLNQCISTIFCRFNQLKNAPLSEFENENIPDAELLSTACFIETVAAHTNDNKDVQYFSRKDSGLKRAIVFDPKNNKVCISAIPEKSTLRASGSYKKVVNFLTLQLLDVTQVPVIQARGFSRASVNAAEFVDLKREARLYTVFKACSNILQIEMSCEHTFSSKTTPKTCSRLTYAMEKFEYTVEQLCANPSLCSIQEKAVLIRDYIVGLSAIHKKGYLHADLKPPNLLFSKKGILRGVLCDLGIATQAVVGRAISRSAAGHYAGGYYGSIWYTSPELFAVENFKGDHFKNEVFAMGFCMYRMLTGTTPNWVHIITKVHVSLNQVTLTHTCDPKIIVDAQAEMKKQVDDLVDNKFLELFAKKQASQVDAAKSLSLEEELHLLIYSMMFSDPLMRPTIEYVREDINRILSLHVPV
jgi:hypothetical protein